MNILKYGVASMLFFGTCCAQTIDYSKPDLYLINGLQTEVQESFDLNSLKDEPHSFEQLQAIRLWIHHNFSFQQDQGASIGKSTVAQICESRRFQNSHDLGILFASVVRSLGYPCVLVETSSATWSEEYAQGHANLEDSQGHLFAEVYFNQKWALFDPDTGFVINGYDPQNPTIHLALEKSDLIFDVVCKGKDDWDMDIFSFNDLLKAQAEATLKKHLTIGDL